MLVFSHGASQRLNVLWAIVGRNWRPGWTNGGPESFQWRLVKVYSDIRIEPSATGWANGWLIWPMTAAIATAMASLSLWRLPVGPTSAELGFEGQIGSTAAHFGTIGQQGLGKLCMRQTAAEWSQGRRMGPKTADLGGQLKKWRLLSVVCGSFSDRVTASISAIATSVWLFLVFVIKR